MSFDPEKITFFAKTDSRGQGVPFGIRAKDRQRHMYVIGKTGMGKSTLLENMAVQDIQNGEGVAFIDPHGSTAETLLEYVPEERIEDVLYFAPFDMARPISFNIMEDVGADKRHLVVSGLMSVFEKIWVDAWSARMAYILQNTLLALLEYPDSTLLGVNRMLSDKNYRQKVVDNVTDPAVKSFWVEEFAKYTDRFAAEATPAIQNKIGQFTSNPVIRNIIGQPNSTFDIREIMDQRKILIMNLSKGLIGETNANLLGSMLTTRIYLAAMSRADLTRQEMESKPNFYFYVDEFQSFANATFANILSEARKYKLNLTIAHQYIEQMEEEVKNAVFGNVGTIISFRVGPFDAEILEQIFTPKFTAADLVNLGFAQIYLTLMIDGIGSQPFSATTLPPIAPPEISYRDMVIAASRRQFGRDRAEVEESIQSFHAPTPPAEKQGASGGGKQNQGGGQNNKGGGEKRQNADQKGKKQRPDQGGDEKKGGSKEADPAALRSVLNKMAREADEGKAENPPSEHKNAPEKDGPRAKQNDKKNGSHEQGGQQKEAPQKDVQYAGGTETEASDRQAQKNKHKQKNDKKRQRSGGSDHVPAQRAAHTQTKEQNFATRADTRSRQEHVDDLRSVLKKLSAEEGSDPHRSQSQTEQHASKSSHHKHHESPDTSEQDHARKELSGAVHGVLEESGGTHDTQEKPSDEAPPQDPNASTGEASPHSQSARESKDEVSPKELERMMRVTTSDRPPLT